MKKVIIIIMLLIFGGLSNMVIAQNYDLTNKQRKTNLKRSLWVMKQISPAANNIIPFTLKKSPYPFNDFSIKFEKVEGYTYGFRVYILEEGTRSYPPCLYTKGMWRKIKKEIRRGLG